MGRDLTVAAPMAGDDTVGIRGVLNGTVFRLDHNDDPSWYAGPPYCGGQSRAGRRRHDARLNIAPDLSSTLIKAPLRNSNVLSTIRLTPSSNLVG
jgi:hypothetical protein